MKYKVGDYVVVYTNEIKEIHFIESISNVIIYYMLDNTSFSENQILNLLTKEEHLIYQRKQIINSFPINYWEEKIEKCAKYTKKILSKKKNSEISWIEEQFRWVKWKFQ